MHGAIFMLLYRRGGTRVGDAQSDAGARAYCVVARDTYTAGAVVTQGYTAGTAREQTYHAGATVAGNC